jgi:hypothetical protein
VQETVPESVVADDAASSGHNFHRIINYFPFSRSSITMNPTIQIRTIKQHNGIIWYLYVQHIILLCYINIAADLPAIPLHKQLPGSLSSSQLALLNLTVHLNINTGIIIEVSFSGKSKR